MVDVLKLQRSTTRYEFADGMRDFQSALWMLIIGFYSWLFWNLPGDWRSALTELVNNQGQLFAGLVIFTLMIGIPLVISLGLLHLMNEYVRRRWLWRNTGFIKPKSGLLMPRTTLLAALTVMFVIFTGGILLAIQLRDWQLIWKSLYLGTGLELSLGYLLLSRQLHMTRYQLVAGAGVVGTSVIVLLPLTLGVAGFMTMLLWAGLLTGSGIYGMREVALMQQETGIADAA